MKILLIGHTMLDHIESVKRSVKPGGVFYNSLGFASIMNEGDELFILTKLNSYLKSFYKRYADKANLLLSINSDDIPEVYLIIHSRDERDEIYKNISGSLLIEQYHDFNDFDGIFINMITGFDVGLDDLFLLRKKYKGKIYFDVHTLARGVDEGGKRIFRKIPDAEKWLSNVNIVQANENELLTLSGKTNELDIANEILNYGVEFLLVTKGNKGARLFYKQENQTCSYFVKADKKEVVNKVGCGDIFGAVFFYFYIASNNIFESLKKAVSAGSLTTTFENFEDYSRLRNAFN